MWHKHFDVNFTLVFTIITISCLGYVLFSQSTVLEEAVAANKIIYLGGAFLQFFIMMSIFSLCRINISRWIRTLMFVICAALYSSVLSTGHSPVFYKNVTFEILDGMPVLNKEYGFLHTIFLIVVCSYFVIGIAAIIYSLRRKKQIPRTAIYLVLIPDLITLLSYFLGKMFIPHVDLIPLGYILAEFMYILIVYRTNLYDIGETVIDSMVRERAIGYISFDFRYRYLGSNSTARKILPELQEMLVDKTLDRNKPGEQKLLHYLDSFVKDNACNTFVFTVHSPDGDSEKDQIYNVNVSYLYDGTKRRGYLVTFTDDTANRKYIRLLDVYNENLKQEVDEKTRHIVQMHDNLILSLAMMVESRDNSTGGHIKRTSENVRILMDEITREGTGSISPEFCQAIIKAAPMHDLGKIAVDDAVLRKPGKFTPEEFEKMKLHTTEGARVIHEILLNTDDELFKTVAENVAHYHHERWDGSGYPEGLAGENIPVEARIMAIADVYDALVSKRVYKDAMSFEKADGIIMEGMGSQFDPGLLQVYKMAKPRLEAYYSSLQEGEQA